VVFLTGSESVQLLFFDFIICIADFQEREGWNPIDQFNTTICLCLYQARAWISNAIGCGHFYVQWFEARGDCSYCWYWWIVDHHCLSFFSYIILENNILCTPNRIQEHMDATFHLSKTNGFLAIFWSCIHHLHNWILVEYWLIPFTFLVIPLDNIFKLF